MRDDGAVFANLPASEIVDAFHRLYYRALGWDRNTFLGYQIKQCPFDMHVYQELVSRIRPQCIIQTGVAGGGSVLYFASLLDLINADDHAIVIGVDIDLSEEARSIRHPRVRLIEGSSLDPRTHVAVEAHLHGLRGMVVLDSDHSQTHVISELKAYCDYVDVGSYLVAEDTNISNQPILSTYGPGPLEAVDEFLEQNDRFVRDDSVWRNNLFSFHQHGWLKRVK